MSEKNPTTAALEAAREFMKRPGTGNATIENHMRDIARALDSFADRARTEQLERMRILCSFIPNEGLRATVLDAMGMLE